nr:MAG TPA: hypothetical protein [Microviridae sp.]
MRQENGKHQWVSNSEASARLSSKSVYLSSDT